MGLNHSHPITTKTLKGLGDIDLEYESYYGPKSRPENRVAKIPNKMTDQTRNGAAETRGRTLIAGGGPKSSIPKKEGAADARKDVRTAILRSERMVGRKTDSLIGKQAEFPIWGKSATHDQHVPHELQTLGTHPGVEGVKSS